METRYPLIMLPENDGSHKISAQHFLRRVLGDAECLFQLALVAGARHREIRLAAAVAACRLCRSLDQLARMGALADGILAARSRDIDLAVLVDRGDHRNQVGIARDRVLAHRAQHIRADALGNARHQRHIAVNLGTRHDGLHIERGELRVERLDLLLLRLHVLRR